MNKYPTPKLQHDKEMFEKFGHKLTPQGKRERRIVANLLGHITEKFQLYGVNDGETITKSKTIKGCMELIFNLDEVLVLVSTPIAMHSVTLIPGEDMDMVSDWNFTDGDPDGFDAHMNLFNIEEFA